ncbi:carbon-nitrogen hydrolase family protein [Ovoidimarina sediminis]|uniref:carbon-nitrogen hydrolase family protein n=1 Tax=Ovoidimarina sediminis TaxID=3079856 RepID=UPI0029104302|nr:carbon-nitrogen hydrolase family protein [Rhodophyticola sp. MJ-SS7]MDU8942425.1 carbon-nitrogen hydrolase family protein [Rhodophyticola sp. MJ-SS7]
MRAALVQLNSSDDPMANLAGTRARVDEAATEGARFVLTPEVTNCVSASRTRQLEVLTTEAEDPTLAGLRERAAAHGIWLLIGSLALKAEDAPVPFVNRSFLIGPDGRIAARYDKIHMFDVDVSETETYRESAAFQPGNRAVLAEVDGVRVGLTICYDLRFPALYRRLAEAGAQILTVPAAFSPGTGPDHWEPLLTARAIETGAFVLAPAQCGRHAAAQGRARETHGHSLAVSPWGRVMTDMGARPGVALVDLDLGLVGQSRRRVPSLSHGRPFEGP